MTKNYVRDTRNKDKKYKGEGRIKRNKNIRQNLEGHILMDFMFPTEKFKLTSVSIHCLKLIAS